MTVKLARGTARVISSILHPYVVLTLVVAVVAYQESLSWGVWARWMAAALLPAYLLPLIYMGARVAMVVRTTGTQVHLYSFFREQPNEMVILACIFGIPSAAILLFLGYPASLIATLVGVATTALLIALINRVYRASFHIALFTSTMVPLLIIFGLPSLTVIPLILMLGASRYYLGEHTLLQLTAGFMLGLMVTVATFYTFGIAV